MREKKPNSLRELKKEKWISFPFCVFIFSFLRRDLYKERVFKSKKKIIFLPVILRLFCFAREKQPAHSRVKFKLNNHSNLIIKLILKTKQANRAET